MISAISLDFLASLYPLGMAACLRKGRTWPLAVRRGSYKSLVLLNPDSFLFF